MRYYTGVGSRSTPEPTCHLMTSIATRLARDGFQLRSGHAAGADQAFAAGARARADIYLPWESFNEDVPREGRCWRRPSAEAFAKAEQIHPAWDRCGRGARALHARNVHQVLGPDLDEPSSFLICWTPRGETIGGTATAIRLAEDAGIPVFNLGDERTYIRLASYARGDNR